MGSYIEIVFRTISVYLFIILAIHLFGKTELAQLSVTDLVFILLISNSVQNAMVGADSTLLGGLIAAASLFALNFIIKRITYNNKSISKFLQGEPILLVHGGVILKKHLEKVRLTEDELLAAMREHGVDSIHKVDLAVLEADGNISILSNNYQQRSTRKRIPHKVIRKE